MGKAMKRRITPADQYANAVRVLKRKMALDAERAAQTGKLAGFDFLRGDLHMHTTWSDGWGRPEEIAECLPTAFRRLRL